MMPVCRRGHGVRILGLRMNLVLATPTQVRLKAKLKIVQVSQESGQPSRHEEMT